MGHRVAAIDLDSRQRTMTRYFENRSKTVERLAKPLPQPAFEVVEELTEERLDEAVERLGAAADIIVIDTPGRDDSVARAAILKADAETVIASLEGGVPPAARRRAEWLPRSLFVSQRRPKSDEGRRGEEMTYTGVVDHVG